MICPACQGDNREEAETCFGCGAPLPGPLRPGRIVAARYEIDSALGRGGMGIVYKAKDRVTDAVVALKVLHADWTHAPEMARRFAGEIQTARRIRHRNVCRILDSGEDAGLRYIVMEFVAGVDLKQLLRRGGGLPADQAFEFAIQLGRGLQAVHDAGIVHRDVKSPNVMVAPDGRVRLMDFDIAKRTEAELHPQSALTATGRVLGTPEYMSPEQARGEVVDARTDIYSLGVVVYEMFTGHVPFRGDTAVATILKHLEEPPPLSGPRAAGIPASLIPVLRKALAKDRERRYTKARGLAEALRLSRSAAGLEEAPPRPAPPAATTGMPALLRALNTKDATVRFETPGAPGQGRAPAPAPPEAVAVLVRALEQEAGPQRARAARALGEIGPPAREAIPILIEALADEDVSVRWDAARALGRMGAAAKEALTGALESPDEVVRHYAAEALARLGRRRARP